MAQVGATSDLVAKNTLTRLRRAALIPYHLGRMTTYVLLAAIFNLAFHAIPESPLRNWISAVLLIIAALGFLAASVPGFGSVFPWLMRLRLPIPFKIVTRLSAPLAGGHRYLLGVILGFIPCGLVMSALIAATSAQTVWQAAGAMAAFSLGTVPALLIVGMGGLALRHRWPGFSRAMTNVTMVFSGLLLIALAGKFVL